MFVLRVASACWEKKLPHCRGIKVCYWWAMLLYTECEWEAYLKTFKEWTKTEKRIRWTWRENNRRAVESANGARRFTGTVGTWKEFIKEATTLLNTMWGSNPLLSDPDELLIDFLATLADHEIEKLTMKWLQMKVAAQKHSIRCLGSFNGRAAPPTTLGRLEGIFHFQTVFLNVLLYLDVD